MTDSFLVLWTLAALASIPSVINAPVNFIEQKNGQDCSSHQQGGLVMATDLNLIPTGNPNPAEKLKKVIQN